MGVSFKGKGSPFVKEIWDQCEKICGKYIPGLRVQKAKIRQEYDQIHESREEYGIGSRYMHRGAYHPSPVTEHYIRNCRRGRIAKRVTKATRPTNRYLFDQEGKLFLVETYIDDNTTTTEYIFHEDNTIYGIKFAYWDKYGRYSDGTFSIERYEGGRIVSYLLAGWEDISNSCKLQINIRQYETYCYDDKGYIIADVYELVSPDTGHFWKWKFDLSEDSTIIPNSGRLLEEAVESCFLKEGTILCNTGDGSVC